MGKKIITKKENNEDRPLVLTIIYRKKNKNYEGDATGGADVFVATFYLHSTEIFSEAGFKIALHGHYLIYNRDYYK
jgi:hypothetical protein